MNLKRKFSLVALAVALTPIVIGGSIAIMVLSYLMVPTLIVVTVATILYIILKMKEEVNKTSS